MDKKQNYYTILGVNSDVGAAELKSAYRKLVKQYHPDVVGDNPNADTKIKEINDAYAILSDPKKRAEYDYNRKTASVQNGTRKDTTVSSKGNSYINFDDLFGDIFSYPDYFRDEKENCEPGHTKTKSAPETSDNVCKRCNGSGLERTTIQSGFGKTTRTRECSLCRGKGK